MLKQIISTSNRYILSSLKKINSRNLYSSAILYNMKIGTHDGTFHCDEALACYMLTQLPEYKDAEIVRTRNQDKLKECDIVVDVGAEFDHSTKRYDHHQREFSHTLSTLKPELGNNYKIRLSSAGLIYVYYGIEVIKELASNGDELPQDDLKVIYKHVYDNFIEEIDAIDNGIPMTDETPRFKIRTHLSNRVSRLNSLKISSKTVDSDTSFRNAIALVGEELKWQIDHCISEWLPARDYVKSSIEDRMQVHKSGSIILLKEFVPWQAHLFQLESEMGLEGDIKYVIFNDKPQSWRVQAVPIFLTSFSLRKPLKKDWWGVRDEILSEKSEIKGSIFCHANGFIGGNNTKEGAIQMAVASLEAKD